jgi:tripartite-type tricarboxylate transporter receptor subunit TctC
MVQPWGRALAIAGFLLCVQPALAAYPEKPVRIVVPVAAGGGADVMARLLAQRLSEKLGQQFFVENRPGAAGVIGSHYVIGSAPDGYTLLYTPRSLSHAVAVRKKPPYDVGKDFTPIIDVAMTPYALVVNKSVRAKTMQEFIAYAKANPTQLSYSSAGIGSASNLAAELFKNKAGIQMVHVPNKGMNPAIVDLIGGQVQAMFAGVPALQAEKDASRVTFLAMAESKRSALMPDLPTISEQGMPDFATNNWAGLLGPAGLDPAITKKLHDGIVAILSTDDMKKRVKVLGYDVVASTPEEFGRQMKADVVRWSEVVEKANIPRN